MVRPGATPRAYAQARERTNRRRSPQCSEKGGDFQRGTGSLRRRRSLNSVPLPLVGSDRTAREAIQSGLGASSSSVALESLRFWRYRPPRSTRFKKLGSAHGRGQQETVSMKSNSTAVLALLLGGALVATVPAAAKPKPQPAVPRHGRDEG